MRTALRAGLLAALAATACGGDDSSHRPRPDPVVVQAFGGVPLFPGAGISDMTGVGEAARATLHISHPPDSAAAWYRRSLLTRRWTIVSDVRAPDGVITLHATLAGRPLWLIFRGDPGSSGTLVTVIGAVPGAGPDSATR
jgi:hypothetical protein